MRAPIPRDQIDAVRTELVAAFLAGRMEDYRAACTVLVTWLDNNRIDLPKQPPRRYNAEQRAHMAAAQRERRQRERRKRGK